MWLSPVGQETPQMAQKCPPLGPVMVADDIEEFEDELILFLSSDPDGFTERDAAFLAQRFHPRKKRAQRVAHRALISQAWDRGDGEPETPGRRIRDLTRDWNETHANAAD